MAHVLRDRLFVRVLLHGALLLGASGAGFLVIAIVILGPALDGEARALAGWFGVQACERAASSPNADAEVASFPIAVAVFSRDGSRLTPSTESRLPTPTTEELSRLREEKSARVTPGRPLAFACPGASSRYAVVSGPVMALPAGRLSLLVAAMIVLVALGSIPLARSLVRPLRDLVATANSFGAGDLNARASVQRSDEIGDLAEAFNRMASNLQAHLMAEKELLANVSHELRTPLARVRVVLETAKENPSRAAALLHEISRDLTDLERLTDDVLAAIRLDFEGAATEAAAIRTRPEQVDVAKIARLAVARCVEAHPDREIELSTDDDDDLPSIDGDPSLLLRLFDNLLDNARKYSSGVVRVDISRRDEGISVAFRDEGIGIERGDLQRVFAPFFRSDRSRGRATGGTGLGLTLCQRIVEAHGGTIEVESEPTSGTTFTVNLPGASRRSSRGPKP